MSEIALMPAHCTLIGTSVANQRDSHDLLSGNGIRVCPDAYFLQRPDDHSQHIPVCACDGCGLHMNTCVWILFHEPFCTFGLVNPGITMYNNHTLLSADSSRLACIRHRKWRWVCGPG